MMKTKIKKNKTTILLTLFTIIAITTIITTSTNKNIVLNKQSNIYSKPANKAFDDDNFYKCVVDNYNEINGSNISYNKSLTDNQLKSITKIDCERMNIQNTKGIEKLTNLNILQLRNNKLTSLDVSHNSELEWLSVDINELTSLDVSKNTKLTFLDASSNELTNLDVSKNKKLAWLSVATNKLSNLDVSKNTELECLDANVNELTSLDVSHNSELKDLEVNANELTSLDLSRSIKLKILWIQRNKLTSLDVSHNPSLINIDAWGNSLTNLNVSHNTELARLSVATNNLSNLDVSSNTKLKYLNVRDNKLTSLDISHNTQLNNLYVESNKLTSLDVSHNPELEWLCVDTNKLSNLDVSFNRELKGLSVESNKLTSLDVSKNTKLEKLYVGVNELTSLDVSHNPELNNLSAESNKLTSLDVSKNTKLEKLYVGANGLTSLDLKGNTSLQRLDVHDNKLTSLDLSKNLKLTYLQAYGNQLEQDIYVYKNNKKLSFDVTKDFFNVYNDAAVQFGKLPNGVKITDNKLMVDISKVWNYSFNGKYNKRVGDGSYSLTFNIYVIEATSNNKNIKIDDEKDKITITGNYDEKAILNNIKLNYGTKEIKNNKLIIKYEEKVVKEFKLIYKVSSVSLDQTSVDLKKKQTVKLNAIINPSNATNKKIIWTSDNNLVATVSDNGLVTAKNAGDAVITATTDDGNKTAKAMINVERPDIVDDGIPKLNIYTYNYESQSNDQYAPINPNLLEYKIYNTDNDCKNDTNGVVVSSSVDRTSWNAFIGEKNVELDNNSLYVEAKVEGAPTGTVLHIRQTKANGYDLNNECKSFKLGETKSVTFTNKPSNSNKYYNIKIDNSMSKKGITDIKTKFYSTEKISVIDDYQKIKTDEYIFLGWLIQRKSDNKYMCYSNQGKNKTEWLSEENCIYGKIQLQNNGDLSGYLTNIKNNETIILKSDWKVPSTIKIELKDTDKKEYKRYAMVLLYNDKNQCDIDARRNIYQPARIATSTDKGQLGWIAKQVQNSNKSSNNGKLTISKQLINKDYYLLVLGSDYYQKLSNNCIKVKANETKTVTLSPKSFKIKFDFKGGKGTVKTNAKNNNKIVDKDIKISVSKMKKNKHKFDYWIAQRKTNNAVQYRCYNASNKKGWYLKSECVNYIKYGNGGKDFSVSINTPGDSITFIAQWKK